MIQGEGAVKIFGQIRYQPSALSALLLKTVQLLLAETFSRRKYPGDLMLFFITPEG